jgi:uncharacterized protein (DUF1330 family)
LQNKSNKTAKPKTMENKTKETEKMSVSKPAYIMVQMKVKSLEDLSQRYAPFVFPILQKYEGTMIAGSSTPMVKEGEWDGNWAAILRFPSMQAAIDWYHAEEYQPYKALRMDEMQLEAGRVVILEGF